MKTFKYLLFLIGLISFSAMATPPVRYWAYWDNDLDGHASKIKEITAAEAADYVAKGWFVVDHKPALDCDDTNDLLFHHMKVWVDNDGDKYVTGYKFMCIGSLPPAGYILEADVLGYTDCNDSDPLVWKMMTLYFDGDADLHVTGITGDYCVGLPATYPVKYVDKASVKGYFDCDDADPTVYRNICIMDPGKPDGNSTICWGDGPHPLECAVKPPTIEYSVYPNPVTDRLNITPNENWNNRIEIRLVDQYGRVARTVNSPSANKGQTLTVNTGDLKPGIYQLTIKHGELMSTKPIAVKL